MKTPNSVSVITTIAKRCLQTSITRSVENESKSTTSELGKAIKQLNKENKALFGRLLETRKQKRKKNSQVVFKNDAYTSGKADFSSEIWWWKATSPKRIVTLHMNWNTNLEPLKSDSLSANSCATDPVLVPQVSKERLEDLKPQLSLTELPLTDVENGAVVNLSSRNFTVPSFDDTSDQISESNTTEVKFQHHTINPYLLPEIVIKHITSFPLKNKEKELGDQYMYDQEILHISSKCESAHKLNGVHSYPSVTRILSATMSESSLAALDRWKQKLILELGEKGFASFQKDLLDQGRRFHSNLHSFLSGSSEDLSLDSSIEGCWESVHPILQNISNVRVLESHVVHPYLKYRGVIDCVAQYCGKPVLIEWKRSDRKKPKIANTYDAPLQLCAYLGALNYDENYKLKVHTGLVVVAYTDGSPAETFQLSGKDCQMCWGKWLGRLQQYWLQKKQEFDSPGASMLKDGEIP